MKIDRQGNMYVVQWFGGKALKVAPDGKLLHVFEITTRSPSAKTRRSCTVVSEVFL
jgi:sugar lactone lactonase YvrE